MRRQATHCWPPALVPAQQLLRQHAAPFLLDREQRCSECITGAAWLPGCAVHPRLTHLQVLPGGLCYMPHDGVHLPTQQSTGLEAQLLFCNDPTAPAALALLVRCLPDGCLAALWNLPSQQCITCTLLPALQLMLPAVALLPACRCWQSVCCPSCCCRCQHLRGPGIVGSNPPSLTY